MDLTESIAPKSDQLDAIDLVSGPRTFTIEKVTPGNAEQPFNFHLTGFPRVWRPGKSMRRVIVAAWGPRADKYVGQQVTLYCDPTVNFGGIAVGGTRISHMTGITETLKTPLLIKRGKSAIYTVEPLKMRDWDAELAKAGNDLEKVTTLGGEAAAAGADPASLSAIRSRYSELKKISSTAAEG